MRKDKIIQSLRAENANLKVVVEQAKCEIASEKWRAERYMLENKRIKDALRMLCFIGGGDRDQDKKDF